MRYNTARTNNRMRSYFLTPRQDNCTGHQSTHHLQALTVSSVGLLLSLLAHLNLRTYAPPPLKKHILTHQQAPMYCYDTAVTDKILAYSAYFRNMEILTATNIRTLLQIDKATTFSKHSMRTTIA